MKPTKSAKWYALYRYVFDGVRVSADHDFIGVGTVIVDSGDQLAFLATAFCDVGTRDCVGRPINHYFICLQKDASLDTLKKAIPKGWGREVLRCLQPVFGEVYDFCPPDSESSANFLHDKVRSQIPESPFSDALQISGDCVPAGDVVCLEPFVPSSMDVPSNVPDAIDIGIKLAMYNCKWKPCEPFFSNDENLTFRDKLVESFGGRKDDKFFHGICKRAIKIVALGWLKRLRNDEKAGQIENSRDDHPGFWLLYRALRRIPNLDLTRESIAERLGHEASPKDKLVVDLCSHLSKGDVAQ